MKIVVIGGVAAGAGAATKARRTNENAEIVLLEKGKYVSFANCGLPYYIGGTIPERDDLILVSPQLFKDRFNIDVRTGNEVTDIDPEKKVVTVKAGDKVYEESYDKLILGLGCTPVRPRIPGADKPGVYCVFTVPDAEAIVNALQAGAKSAVVVGGGFIGLETAENLAERGIQVTLVEGQDQLLTPMDPEFSMPVEAELKKIGVNVRLGRSVSEITGDALPTGVKLDNGEVIDAQLVVMAVGVRPQLDLAKKAGIAIGPAGGIEVDAAMRTSVHDIYAAGDIVESINLVTGKKVRNSLAGSANKQGRIAGCNAAGGELYFKGVLGTAIIKVGGLTCAWTGLNEKKCLENGYAVETTYLYSGSSAGYYPGSESMVIKVTFLRESGKLLGAQIVGRKGVDKRIDVFATAIYSGLTTYDLENLDLAYAPPYASAKDPIVMAGMVSSNLVRGIVKAVSPFEAEDIAEKEENTILLDVRSEEEYNSDHLRGAVNFPVDTIRPNMEKLDKSKRYLVCCGVGYRAYVACRILAQNGYDVTNVSGGYWTNKMDV